MDKTSLVVPALWSLEIANGFNVALRRKRSDESRVTQFIARIETFSFKTDHLSPDRAVRELRLLALQHQLTVYDAAYLDVAIRTGLPLATLDFALKRAARAVEVGLVLEA